MKRMYIIIGIIGLILFTGCVGAPKQIQLQPSFKQDGAVVIISRADFSEKLYPPNVINYFERTKADKYSVIVLSSKFNLQQFIKKAAELTLVNNNKYFAIVNKGVNNIEGFPINNFDSLNSYCFSGLSGRKTNFTKKDDDICSMFKYSRENIKIELEIVMFKENNQEFDLWDAEQTLKELK